MKIAVVTGASGGLGWELCIQLDDQIDLFILCGSQNSDERLKELKSLLKTKCLTYSFDAASGDVSFITDNRNVLQQATTVMGFWLAGSLGTLVRIPQVLDIDQTLRLNVTAPIVQTQTLLKNINELSKLLIVNFSSLAALQPFDCWSLYCTGKAARDAFFQCLAHESEMGSREARVLNYAPGPCITRMKDQILDSMPQVPLKISMEKVSWIPVKESIRVLLKILDQDEFTNGAHVDYYDC